MIPGGFLFSITWCMAGMLAGNYQREIEEKKELVDQEKDECVRKDAKARLNNSRTHSFLRR